MIEAAFFFGRKKAAFFVVVCGTQTGMLGIDMVCGTQTRTYNNIKSWGIVQAANLNNPTQYRLIWEQ